MSTDKHHMPSDDELLAEFFGAARRRPEPVDSDLMARVLADAAALQPVAAALPARRAAEPERGFGTLLKSFFAGRAGFGQAAGLAAAAVCGLWLGLVQPVSLGVAASVDAEFSDMIELLPDSLDVWAQELGIDLEAQD